MVHKLSAPIGFYANVNENKSDYYLNAQIFVKFVKYFLFHQFLLPDKKKTQTALQQSDFVCNICCHCLAVRQMEGLWI